MIKKECLDIVQAKCENCQDCVLGKTRNNVVFSDGNPETARIVLIGEAPGETEDETGTPFVGRAGKLLNQFLEEAGISRKDDLYIINTVKCRPPENRVPTDVEKALCERYLTAQIDIMNPQAIIKSSETSASTAVSTMPKSWLSVVATMAYIHFLTLIKTQLDYVLLPCATRSEERV